MSLEISSAGLRSAGQMQFQSAKRIAVADQPGSGVNMVDEAITQNVSREMFNANLTTLKTQDEMMGTLLDIMA